PHTFHSRPASVTSTHAFPGPHRPQSNPQLVDGTRVAPPTAQAVYCPAHPGEATGRSVDSDRFFSSCGPGTVAPTFVSCTRRFLAFSQCLRPGAERNLARATGALYRFPRPVAIASARAPRRRAATSRGGNG